MFVAAELIRPLEAVGASSQSNSNDFAENDKVEVLYKGDNNNAVEYSIVMILLFC